MRKDSNNDNISSLDASKEQIPSYNSGFIPSTFEADKELYYSMYAPSPLRGGVLGS